MDTHIKEFSIVLFVLLVAVWIYLLLVQRINTFELAIMILATGFSVVLLYNIEHTKKIFLKLAGHEFGVEWEKIRDEVYAKAEEVKKMGEEIAETTVFTITRLGRFAPKDLDKQLVEHRDKLAVMLKNIGSDQKKIEEITEQINRVVVNDLANDAVRVVNNTINKKISTGIRIEKDKILEATGQYFNSYELNKTRSEITEYLKSIDCYSTEIEEPLDRYEYFLKNKKLR